MAKQDRSASATWDRLNRKIVRCDRCPRLREHCLTIAQEKRAAYRDWTYWGKPVPNLGDPHGRLLIVGLAPAAHGANRTGRMFTGDRSGDFLFAAMHAAGFANQPTATDRDDGLMLQDIAITAAAHCAPPANKPTTEELAKCRDWFEQSVDLFTNLRGFVALGRIGFDQIVKLYRDRDWLPAGPRPKFAHGAAHTITGRPFVICSYHPSQQNTFTGRLTLEMLTAVFTEARRRLDG